MRSLQKTTFSALKKWLRTFGRAALTSLGPILTAWASVAQFSATTIYGALRPCTEKRLSLSYPSFYADLILHVNNSYQWKNPLLSLYQIVLARLQP